MKDFYLKRAEENLPPMYYETVASERNVRIVSDEASFLGFSALPDGKIPAVVKTGDRFVVDFGRHCVGRVSFTMWDNGRYIDAPVRLRMRFAEVPYELGRDHASYHGGLCSSWLMEDIFNFDRIGRIELPRRYSFRYLEVTVLATPRPTRLYDFSVVCETSADVSKLVPLPEGTDPELVAIDRVAADTLRDCMQSAYEDGPKRDRRLWSGDLRLQALTDHVLFGNDMLARRCLYLFAAAVREGKYLPGCIYQYPAFSFDNGMEIPDYSMLWCTAVNDYFEKTGDLETVRELFPVVKNEIGLAIDTLDENGIATLPEGGWPGFIDWAPGLEHVTAVHGAYLYGLEHVIPLARALGEDALAEKWEKALKDGRAAAMEQLFDAESGAFINTYEKGTAAVEGAFVPQAAKRATGSKGQFSVQSQVWMVLGGVLGGEAGACAIKKALADPDSVKPVTPYMHHYLVEAMLKLDMRKEALSHIKSYWGAMVRYGADTFWEVFVDGEPEKSAYNDPLMHSFCHAWSCSPSYFIRKYFV
ncbi:MAG: glycoside hydrolase [Ruminococcaceae bacterium]|nr:glycoside hydrolase [Oscillospiraceae bacterium]